MSTMTKLAGGGHVFLVPHSPHFVPTRESRVRATVMDASGKEVSLIFSRTETLELACALVQSTKELL